MLVTFVAHTVIFKQSLNGDSILTMSRLLVWVMLKSLLASVIFPAMTAFGIVREQLNRISWQVAQIIQGERCLQIGCDQHVPFSGSPTEAGTYQSLLLPLRQRVACELEYQ